MQGEENLVPIENPTKSLNYGQAISAMRDGYRVARDGWNGKGLFVFMQVPATIEADIVPKMQSLPQSVKNEFQKRFESGGYPTNINYKNQFAIVNPDNSINGWVASSSDTLAEDWCILD